MKRNLSIDLVKTIAMFMVLILHIGLLHPENTLFYRCTHGIACIAIPLFFMVSGYLMAGKIIDRKYILNKVKTILVFIVKTTSMIIIVEFCFFNHNLLQLLPSYYSWIRQHGMMWQYWYFASMLIIYMMLPLLQKIIHSKYLMVSIMVLISVCFTFFLLDIFFGFEKKYIRQTFRIWYWIMYFLIGAYIRIHHNKFSVFNWKISLIICFVYTFFQVSTSSFKLSNEYYFGSIICMIYAFSVFMACLNLKIKNSSVIRELSNLFLPIYAIHPYVISKLSYVTPYIYNYSHFHYLALFSLVVGGNVILAYLLTRIPCVKNIFKMY